MSALDRLLLLATSLLAAYQVVAGVEGLATLPILAYTVGFGVLLIAGLLLIIFGFEALDSSLVVIIAAIIPLSLALGLVAEHLPAFTTAYGTFAVIGLLAIAVTRLVAPTKIATMVLAAVHGIAGLIISLLPIILSLAGRAPAAFALVGVGGALIGIGGLLLAFLKAGRPILSEKSILTVLPGLLLLTTAAFVVGFAAAKV